MFIVYYEMIMGKKHGKLSADEPRQVSIKETEILLRLLTECLELEGDVVELGCYRGDTSVHLERQLESWRKRQGEFTGARSQDLDGGTEFGREKELWVYDSFEGLPEKSIEDSSAAGEQFQAGELYVTKREVMERFRRAGLKMPKVKKAFFENLDNNDLPKRICFGFLDGDLYNSIKISLKLCAPKVVSGGILVVHDYNNPELPGVSWAVEEFLKANHSSIKLEVRESLAIMRFILTS